LSDAIKDLILHPLTMMRGLTEEERKNVRRGCLRAFFSEQFSPQVKHFLLPNLARNGDFFKFVQVEDVVGMRNAENMFFAYLVLAKGYKGKLSFICIAMSEMFSP